MIEHWMMFSTFAEQNYFAYPSKDTYDGTIINANMAAHAPGGLAAFLTERTAGFNYLIDPLTHAFQHDTSAVLNREEKIKTSIKKIADAYGAPVADKVGKKPVSPEDFAKSSVLAEFVRRCVDFQRTVLAMEIKAHDSMKYIDAEDSTIEPNAIVAPYFFMTEATFERWLPVFEGFIVETKSSASGMDVLVPVVLSQGLLVDESAMSAILEIVKKTDVAGYLVWVDDLDEHQASTVELRQLLDLCRELRAGGSRRVINTHGGYFSVLCCGALGKQVMSGVAHGPEFGEHRGVVPVGGGIPVPKYYVPALHGRVKYREALRLLLAKEWLESADIFHANVCGCEACSLVLAGDVDNFHLFGDSRVREVRRRGTIVRMEYPTPEAKEKCLRHYLWRKTYEYGFVNTASTEEQLADLDRGIEAFEEIREIEVVAHLVLWKRALQQ